MADATIDLNSDLGGGFGIWTLGDDDALLTIVTSANVACGFHAGDPTIMRRVCQRAADLGVAIGAKVGYRDLAGFGRRAIDVDPTDLLNDVVYQIGALDAFARIAGTRVRYVKPHGALYNTTVTHVEQSAALVQAVLAYDPGLPVLGLRHSEWLRQAAAAGLTTVQEGFADRAYTADAHLVPRRLPRAVLHDPEEVIARSVSMARSGTVRAIDGTRVRVDARSLCLNGVTPDAVRVARRVREALSDAGVRVAPFTDASTPG
jgi:5-oxoprolinase (ATP-hydrolysing) subunit A